jgi:phosphocarrier protein
MIYREVTIINKLGLHARAAAKLVTCASEYSSDILLSNSEQSVNGKSIMGVMLLAAGQGTVLALTASGDDENAAADALETLISDRFGEDQ